jgi:hypothetical protein
MNVKCALQYSLYSLTNLSKFNYLVSSIWEIDHSKSTYYANAFKTYNMIMNAMALHVTVRKTAFDFKKLSKLCKFLGTHNGLLPISKYPGTL